MWYSLDIDRLIRLTLPAQLNQLRHYAWLRALLSPLNVLHEAFKAYRTDFNKKLQYNGQVIVLEAILNDAFGLAPETIKVVTNPSKLSQVYVYPKESEKSVYIYRRTEAEPVYIFKREEVFQSLWDFTVIVPDGILTPEQEKQLKALTHKWRLDGKFPLFIYESNQTF